MSITSFLKRHNIFTLFILVFSFIILIFIYKTSANGYNSKILEKNINNILKNKKMNVGVSVKIDDKFIFTLNGNKSFPLMSVFKFYVALAVFDNMDINGIDLDYMINVHRDDIRENTYSPLREKNGVRPLKISIKELVNYAITYSDNNACDILIGYVGGIKKVNDYIKSLGVDNFAIVVDENDMHVDEKNQYLNISTPNSLVNLIELFYTKSLFSRRYKDFLIDAMIRTTAGQNKIKGLLPSNVVVGHKTGSSSRINGVKVADNDAGFVVLKNGKVYFISILISDSNETDEDNAEVIAKISREIYKFVSINYAN